jgi:phospholipase/lecithinase/hemolysin
VTDPNGIRHDAGALTVPIKTQIANHLDRFGRFTSRDLVILWAGANDLLWEMEQDPAKNPNSFVVQLFTALGLLQAGAITPGDAQAMIAAAQQASAAAMKTAGLQMTAYIRDEILAKGGKYVVVMNLPDAAVTPEGVATAAVSPILGAALTAFSDAFNQGLSEGLSGQPVRTIDVRRLLTDVVARPASYRMVNASTPACDADKMAVLTGGAVTDGFSLFCNASPDPRYNGIRSGADVETWFFADGNHPTVGGYKVISGEVLRKLKSFGWLEDREHEDAR